MLNGLDLFSGIGGITLALSEWVRPVVYCEIERYAQAVLLSRMADGTIPVAPIWDDVTTLNAEIINEPIDIIYGGFPCQDISVAGRGAGLAGERSGLFYQIARLTNELRPSFVFLENVPAITVRGGLDVIGEFTKMGYDCRWCVISAESIGANHKRERWFLLANSPGIGLEKRQSKPGDIRKKQPPFMRKSWWAVEPDVGRVAHGVPFRPHRVKGLGNSVVPLQAKKAFEICIGKKGGVR